MENKEEEKGKSREIKKNKVKEKVEEIDRWRIRKKKKERVEKSRRIK